MGWPFKHLGISRYDAPDCWVIGANGKSILPLTGEYTVRLSFYAEEGQHHLELCDSEGDIVGWCLTQALNDRVFEAISKLIERLLMQGWGPLNIASFFNDVRSGAVKLNTPPDPERVKLKIVT
jgi:hypothetical protein